MLKILLIRHGECLMNLDLAERIGGRSAKSPLTPLGSAQSAALGRALRQALPDVEAAPHVRCFSSTALRAVETARLALKVLGLDAACVSTSDALLEQDMGEWEGALRAECYTPTNLALIEADTHGFAAPGGESQRDVEQRVMSFVLGTVLPATRPGHPTLVFGHGMAFKCVLRHLLGSDARMSRKIALGNASITEIGWVPEGADGASSGLQPGWHILRVNDTAHLRQLHVTPPVEDALDATLG